MGLEEFGLAAPGGIGPGTVVLVRELCVSFPNSFRGFAMQIYVLPTSSTLLLLFEAFCAFSTTALSICMKPAVVPD